MKTIVVDPTNAPPTPYQALDKEEEEEENTIMIESPEQKSKPREKKFVSLTTKTPLDVLQAAAKRSQATVRVLADENTEYMDKNKTFTVPPGYKRVAIYTTTPDFQPFWDAVKAVQKETPISSSPVSST